MPRRDALLAFGISHRLAKWRATRYSNVRYRIEARIDASATDLRGRITVAIDMRRRGRIIFDWRAVRKPSLRSLRVNGVSCPAAALDSGHLIVPTRATQRGENIVEIDFAAPIAVTGQPLVRFDDPKDGSVYVYSLLVPADASAVFPCFDQPDLKARFTFTLTVPSDWTAIGNAPLGEPPMRDANGSKTATHRFSPTEPISTYLFAFAAGPFVTHHDHRATPWTTIYARRSQGRRLATNAPLIARLASAAVHALSDYLAHPFPFAKNDLVLIPEFAFGGMEHAGATFLREDLMLLAAKATPAARLRRSQLLFHELAHQWMGNLVTMRWFDDLWVKEGFANFLAARLVETMSPRQDAATFLRPLKAAAARIDASRGRHPLRQRLANMLDAKSLYGPIVYGKGPALLRQAEYAFGEGAFRRAARALVQLHAYDAFDSHDLVRALEAATGCSLTEWANAWIYRAGIPRSSVTLADRAISVVQNGGGAQTIALSIGTQRTLTTRSIDVGPGTTTTKLRAPASFAVLNANDRAYGEFTLDRVSREWLLAKPRRAAREPMRSALADSLWIEVEHARLAPLDYIGHALAALDTKDASFRATSLRRIEIAFKRYLSAWQRRRVAPLIDRHLKAVASRTRTDRDIFIAGAARPTRAAKTRYLHRLITDPSIPEDWVEACLPALFDPQHAALTEPLLGPALRALPRLHARHKIFFVNRWLEALVGGQTEASALRTVAHAAAWPSLSRELRAKVLEARDTLATTVRIRRRYAREAPHSPMVK
ncbi:MAG: M1 family aminopeptidase [Burkholderiales bacterium]